MTVESLVPFDLKDKFVELSMKPKDWTLMWGALNGNENNYRQVVLDYQARQWEALPRCNTWFGCCICYDHGRCTSKEFCRSKVM